MCVYSSVESTAMPCCDPHLALVKWKRLKRLSIEVKFCHDGLTHSSDERA